MVRVRALQAGRRALGDFAGARAGREIRLAAVWFDADARSRSRRIRVLRRPYLNPGRGALSSVPPRRLGRDVPHARARVRGRPARRGAPRGEGARRGGDRRVDGTGGGARLSRVGSGRSVVTETGIDSGDSPEAEAPEVLEAVVPETRGSGEEAATPEPKLASMASNEDHLARATRHHSTPRRRSSPPRRLPWWATPRTTRWR